MKTALITGASSGIGEAFSRRLASDGYNIVLVARREDLLGKIAHELETQFNIQAEFIKADLTNPVDIERVEYRIYQIEELDFLINSAGFGILAPFSKIPVEQSVGMIECHIVSMVRFCRAALPGMIARKKGTIINISSFGAFTPKRGDTVYCGTKAFINIFSEALQSELKGTGVRVQALCPGFTLSGFHDTPTYLPYQVKKRVPGFLWNTPDEVVAKSFEALKGNKVVYIPWFKNKLIVAMAKSGLTGLLVSLLTSLFPKRPSGVSSET